MQKYIGVDKHCYTIMHIMFVFVFLNEQNIDKFRS